ncbi:ArsR family transcriptional regulator [Candidatus Nanosalina sp. VS9-1]|uniref:ArsR family transcriptional regulator n=1 Tax=Candidatus Nanosalina sp. VS9-1 TaxID=3388566 RepID=UPI0039E179D9
MRNLAKILNALNERPRNFSDLKKETGLANGVIQHHADNSERIVREKDVLMLRSECDNCPLKGLCREKCMLNVLADEKKKFIVEKFNECSQASISRQLDVSRATVHYHVEKLREAGVIENEAVRPEVKSVLQP